MWNSSCLLALTLIAHAPEDSTSATATTPSLDAVTATSPTASTPTAATPADTTASTTTASTTTASTTNAETPASTTAETPASTSTAMAATTAEVLPPSSARPWLNGSSHQRTFPLGSFAGVTPSLYVDVNTAFSTHQPVDHTLTGSGSVSRHNEIGVNMASAGVEWNVAHVVGRLHLQFGNTLAMVQDGDASVARGQTLSVEVLKHLREAAVGYHFDVLDGVNVEAGLFASFVGVDSYLLADNWLYNRALVSEFTPFYFTGVRTQVFIGAVKIEPWILNGYQSYGRFNEAPAAGLSVRWAASDALVLVGNGYVGFDTLETPERARLHHDHALQWRLFNSDDGAVLHRLALSVNNHLGGETGGGASFDDHLFVGTAVAARGWLLDDAVAVSLRGEWLHERGAYSLQLPPAGFDDDVTFMGATVGVEWMPTDFFSVRPEAVYRTSSAAFFAGPGGTTGDDAVDLRTDQLLFTVAATARL